MTSRATSLYIPTSNPVTSCGAGFGPHHVNPWDSDRPARVCHCGQHRLPSPRFLRLVPADLRFVTFRGFYPETRGRGGRTDRTGTRLGCVWRSGRPQAVSGDALIMEPPPRPGPLPWVSLASFRVCDTL